MPPPASVPMKASYAGLVSSVRGTLIATAQPKCSEWTNAVRTGTPSRVVFSTTPSRCPMRCCKNWGAACRPTNCSRLGTRVTMTPCRSNTATNQPAGICWRRMISSKASEAGLSDKIWATLPSSRFTGTLIPITGRSTTTP